MIKLPRHALDTFVRCPRKYYYNFELGLEPKVEEDYIIIGNMYHTIMERFYLGQYTTTESRIAMAQGVVAEFGIIGQPYVELVMDMFWYWLMNRDNYDYPVISEVISAEWTYLVQVGDHLLPVTPDLVFRDPTGHLGILDHKTVGNIKDSLAFLLLDPQLHKHAMLGQQIWGEIPDLWYSMHRRALPPDYIDWNGTRPYGLTPTGRDSTRSTKVEDYLRAERLLFTPKQIAAFESELITELKDMQSAIDRSDYSRRIIKGGKYGCTGCPYFGPCTREFEGNRLDSLSLRDYTKKA